MWLVLLDNIYFFNLTINSSVGKESACNAGGPRFHPWVGKIPWRRERLPTPVLWPAEFRGLYSPWGHKESDATELFSLYCLRVCILICFTCVWPFATLWTLACQTPLSVGFSRPEYCSRLPCPFPGVLPDPVIEPSSLMSPALAGGFFATSATWESLTVYSEWQFKGIYINTNGLDDVLDAQLI